MEKKIIPLYMSSYSSHLLQPLDVSCFAPLKHLYDQRVQEEMQKGIHSVGKEDFIHIYLAVHQQALSSLNIQSGFKATGLVPLLSERILLKFQKIPTPSRVVKPTRPNPAVPLLGRAGSPSHDLWVGMAMGMNWLTQWVLKAPIGLGWAWVGDPV